MKDIDEVVQTIYDDDQKQRVVIFRRQNGNFGFVKEYFSQDEFEMCWMPRSRNISFFDTLEIALHEVYGRVDWLIGQEPPL